MSEVWPFPRVADPHLRSTLLLAEGCRIHCLQSQAHSSVCRIGRPAQKNVHAQRSLYPVCRRKRIRRPIVPKGRARGHDALYVNSRIPDHRGGSCCRSRSKSCSTSHIPASSISALAPSGSNTGGGSSAYSGCIADAWWFFATRPLPEKAQLKQNRVICRHGQGTADTGIGIELDIANLG